MTTALAPVDLAAAATTYQSVLDGLGLSYYRAEVGVAVDCSESNRDEHGLGKDGRPDPRLDNLMNRAVGLSLAAASVVDPNRQAQGVVFSEIARLGEPIRLGDHEGWLARHLLEPHEQTTTNMAGALMLLIEAMAKELGVPELAELNKYVDHRVDHKDPAKRSLHPGHVVVLPTPVELDLFTDGDPDDYDNVEALVRAYSFAAVRVNAWYISNQPAGLEPLKHLAAVHGRYTNNFSLVNLGQFAGGLRGVSVAQFMALRAQNLHRWYGEITEKRMLNSAR